MPFCTSCGKEVAPGQKFCDQCGSPIEQAGSAAPLPAPEAVAEIPPAAPPVPEAPPVPPAPQEKKPIVSPPTKDEATRSRTKIVVAVVIILVVLAAAAYYAILPMIGAGGALPVQVPGAVQTTETPAMESVPATMETPAPAAISTPETETTEQVIVHDDVTNMDYLQVYNITDTDFTPGTTKIFSYDLTTPPMVVRYVVSPVMTTSKKMVNIGTSSEHLIDAMYPNPDAYLEITIYNADNNAIISQHGFQKKIYSSDLEQEFKVLAPGNYRIEIAGDKVTADVRMVAGQS